MRTPGSRKRLIISYYIFETVEDGVIMVERRQAIEACLDSWKSAARSAKVVLALTPEPTRSNHLKAFKSGSQALTSLTNKTPMPAFWKKDQNPQPTPKVKVFVYQISTQPGDDPYGK